MKKITAILGTMHNDFERQVKDSINDISDCLGEILKEQKSVIEYQNAIVLKQYAEIMKSPICGECQKAADVIIINIGDNTYKSYCSHCVIV